MSKKDYLPSIVPLLILGSISLLRKEGDVYRTLIMGKAGVLSGSFYPVLKMLQERGMIIMDLEEESITELKRSPRVLIYLTDKGKRFVEEFGLEKLVGIVPFSEFE